MCSKQTKKKATFFSICQKHATFLSLALIACVCMCVCKDTHTYTHVSLFNLPLSRS